MHIEEYSEDPQYVAIHDCTVQHETDKAIKVDVGLPAPIWVPTGGKHIHEDSDVYAMGTEGTLIISKWLAEQKELW